MDLLNQDVRSFVVAREPVNAAEAAKAADLCYAVALQAKTNSTGKLLSRKDITFNLNRKQEGIKTENTVRDKKLQTVDNNLLRQ
jgi:hypothetical protein